MKYEKKVDVWRQKVDYGLPGPAQDYYYYCYNNSNIIANRLEFTSLQDSISRSVT